MTSFSSSYTKVVVTSCCVVVRVQLLNFFHVNFVSMSLCLVWFWLYSYYDSYSLNISLHCIYVYKFYSIAQDLWAIKNFLLRSWKHFVLFQLLFSCYLVHKKTLKTFTIVPYKFCVVRCALFHLCNKRKFNTPVKKLCILITLRSFFTDQSNIKMWSKEVDTAWLAEFPAKCFCLILSKISNKLPVQD